MQTTLNRLRGHVGRNLVAYVALFVALSSSAYAAKPLVTGADIQDNTIQSVDLQDGDVQSVDISAAIARDAEILPAVLAGDGSDSTLDADLLDGLSSSAFLGASAKAADSDLLDGLNSSAFLGASAKAADSELLDGLNSSAFLGASAKAADSDKLDGQDSSAFLGASAKAADSDKLDGQDSTEFSRRTIGGLVFENGTVGFGGSSFTVTKLGTGIYRVSFPEGTFGGVTPIAVATSATADVFETVTLESVDEVFIVRGRDADGAAADMTFWFIALRWA